jgi:asparagine synthase (glutamine-hydrolysing)
MCGISGIFHFDQGRKVEQQILKRMTDTLSHRGPDGSGFFVDGRVGLGHRRLSIIDLTTGDQPQFSDDGQIAIVFNGEIYNYIELRKELEALGHVFRTTSDTEVIIHGYRQWGLDCQNKFNGMWAFSLWDSQNQQMFISRDRLGEKPLYYGLIDNSLVFGSEIKALLAYGHKTQFNYNLTELYLSLGYLPAPYSYYKNIYKLKQGHYIIVKDTGYRESKYWDLPEVDEHHLITDAKQVYSKFEELLYDSIKIRMRSDVPFGAFLSGGLDSASIVALMSEIQNEPVQTFTIGFSEREFDERRLAKEVAEKFNTAHSEFLVDPDSFEESLRRISYHYDEPFGDSSAIPTGYVSKIASQKVKMVLTGDGGDEVLSGYNAYQIEKFATEYQRLPKHLRTLLPQLISPIKIGLSGGLRYKANRVERILRYSNKSFNDRLIIKSAWHDLPIIQKLTAGLGDQITLPEFIDDFYSKYSLHDPFYKLMLFHHKVQLPDDFLVKVDRMSMAYSIETRVPFLDHRLVEFMFGVSKLVKMKGYARKSILRETIGKKLPLSLLRSNKKGFRVPVRDWFKDKSFNGRLSSLYTENFGLDRKLIKLIVRDNQMGKADYGNFIWMLFVLKECCGSK